MKRILVTHTDLDGAGCAILCKREYPDIEVRYHDYDTIDEVSKELWDNKDDYYQIIFADITPNEEIGMMMANYTGESKFVFIDHHITREYLKTVMPYSTQRIIYDTKVCATCLTANYLDSLYGWKFVYGVDAYDTWKLDSEYREYGLKLNLLFNYYGMDEFVIEFSALDEIDGYEERIIKVLERVTRDYLAEKLRQGKQRIDKDDNIYFEVYVCEHSGHVGVLLDDPNFPPECRYIKTINLNEDVVGLYSKDDFDVSVIAKEHGGGGHPGAAGYQLNTPEDNIKCTFSECPCYRADIMNGCDIDAHNCDGTCKVLRGEREFRRRGRL